MHIIRVDIKNDAHIVRVDIKNDAHYASRH